MTQPELTLDRSKIEEALKEILNKKGVNKLESINEETNLTNDLGFDSLDGVELIMAIEEKFNVHFPDSKTKDLKTIGDIITLVIQLKSEAQGN
jgi:acyl carrier protein